MSEAAKRLTTYAMLGASLPPQGPPGPPTHDAPCVSEDQLRLIERLRDRADLAEKNYRDYVVGIIRDGATIKRMSEATGVSEYTLQLWKAWYQ